MTVLFRNKALLAVALLCCYVFLLVAIGERSREVRSGVRLGYLPDERMLKPLLADFRLLYGEWLTLKVIFYYGERAGDDTKRKRIEYSRMSHYLKTSLKLDPWNSDAYYITQAAFIWDVKGAREVNNVLVYGMKYRTWDYQLPFFAGFNYAYFLKDYKSAAFYMKRAAQISGESLFTTLAARYFYQAGETDLGIIFLKDMERGATGRMKKVYAKRRAALEAVRELQTAVTAFRRESARCPGRLDELVTAGLIPRIPADPYGGEFYLDNRCVVATTSKFATPGKSDDSN